MEGNNQMPDRERQLYLEENERLTKLVDSLTAMVNAQKDMIAIQTNTINAQAEMLAANTDTINSQTETINAQTDTINVMAAKIDALEKTIKELTERVNMNSHNSSKPPSGDGFKKPKKTRSTSQREKSGKKPGGQKGHKGSHMSIPHKPDDVKKHYPDKCLKCPHLANCVLDDSVFSCGESRYVVDVEVTTKVTKHETIKTCKCPLGEPKLSGAFPKDVKAYVQYGDSVYVLAGLLSTYGAVSLDRIHVLLGSMMNVRLAPGTISRMVHTCAKRVGPAMEKVKGFLQKALVGFFDESGLRAEGKLRWVHNSSTELFTYLTISHKRGKEGIDENGVLPFFHGVAMHDCWSPYWKYEGILHAICNAHLLRELTGIMENNPEHQWPARFKTLLRNMKKAKEKAMEKDKSELSRYYLQKFSREYDAILKMADLECPDPSINAPRKRGRKKKGKERCLIERLMRLKDAVCLFIHDFNVPFDNNQAERDIRNVKTKGKVSGCFRTDKGAQDYLDVMSFLSTGKKHGISVFDALTAAFSGNAEIILQTGGSE